MPNDQFVVYTEVPPVAEGSVALYSGTLTQEDGVTPVPGASIDSIVVTLTDVVTGAVINSRNQQSLINVNGGTFDVTGTTGAFSWELSADDNPFLRSSPPPLEAEQEMHQAIIEWSWNGSTRTGKKKIFIPVEKFLGATRSLEGNGSSLFESILLAEDGETVVDDALVWVTNDAEATDVVCGPKRTDTQGAFSFHLDPGSYYLQVQHPSYNFTPTAFTVT